MTIENLACEVKEQKNEKVLVRDEWNKYYGELDTEEKMESAGRMLVDLIENEGKKVGRAFYTWLHEDTKFYLKKPYKEYISLIKTERASISMNRKTAVQRNYDRFLILLQKRQYKKAREFAVRRLGSKIDDAYEISTYCHAGYNHLDFLLIMGKGGEARRCAKSLKLFKFNQILTQLYKEMRNNRVDKPYKAGRRN